MDETLLCRLRLILSKMKTDLGLIPSTLTVENLMENQLAQSRLETTVRRFDNDLHEYFRLAQTVQSDEISQMSQTQLEAEEALAELGVKIKGILSDMKTNENKTSNSTNFSNRLPKLSLPEFDGNILEWHQYWDQFRSNIDSKNLSDVDKLSYLKASLKGDAKRTIEGLETTNRNYNIALTTLKERYGKSSYLIDAHYSTLYKIQAAKNTSTECRKALDEIERNLRVLESLGEDVNHNHLRFLIIEKFPAELIYELKLKVSMESIQEIRNHLEKAVSAREDAERIAMKQQPGDTEPSCSVETLHVQSKQMKYRNSNIKDNRFQRREITENKGSNKYLRKRPYNFGKERSEIETNRNPSIAKRSRGPYCVFCNESHFSDQCTNYKSVAERRSQLGERCYNCLQRGHIGSFCNKLIKCIHCNRTGHNRALCYSNFQRHHNSKSPQ